VVARAFPGDELIIDQAGGRLAVALRKPALKRPLSAAELSDGTLRFLCLAAALLSPRPAQFLALNEPETSLHPDLLPALATLVVQASERCQVLVTTHAHAFAAAIAAQSGIEPLRLRMSEAGETEVDLPRGLLQGGVTERNG
jgi:predicted ATPase